MIAKRGVKIDAVYFHAPPYTSDRAKQSPEVFENSIQAGDSFAEKFEPTLTPRFAIM